MPVQNNWWWCNKRQSLAFGGGLSQGTCQAGGQHDHSGSGEYSLVGDDPAAPGQPNWRHCTKCETLVYAGNATPGPCPATGQHDHAGSGNYVLATNQPATPFTQPNWRHCTKCETLVYAGNPTPGSCPATGQHDHAGSADYTIGLHDRSEPIDQAVNRHLLTEFGPCNDVIQARSTLDKACAAMTARGGGVVVIPSSVPAGFLPRNVIQDVGTSTKPGALIEDFRGGAMRLFVLPQGVVDDDQDVAGGVILERDLVDDVHGQGGGSALAIANHSRGGVNSINDVILQDIPADPEAGLHEARFYVESLRGLCPGNWVTIANKDGKATSGPIKAVGLDGDDPYFVADTDLAFQKGDRFWNKNWFGALEIADTHNVDDQSGTVSIARTTYGTGDTFGVQTHFTYSGDIMSAGGDEGGVVYSADVHHDVDLFWGKVEGWNADTLELVYKNPPQNDPSHAEDQPFNFWKIGTSRPIINMNPATWITSGRVTIPLTTCPYSGMPSPDDPLRHLIIGNTDVQWDQSVIGKFITIDEPSEYWDPKTTDKNSIDPRWAYLLGDRIVRRWFQIATMVKRPDGLWSLGIETVWWGNHRGGKPALMNDRNHFTSQPNELRYIIAPGSWVMEVRNALGPKRYVAGATPQERTIRLAPFHNADTAFTRGDPICQPAGPTPWTPTSYRTRNANVFPPLIAGDCFVAGNLGPMRMGAGLLVDDGRGRRSLPDTLKDQKDGLMPFDAGVEVRGGTKYGVLISGPVQEAAVGILQYLDEIKAIEWLGNAGHRTSIYRDPQSDDFTINTSGNVNLSQKGTVQQRGLSATPKAANNLRGISVPVPGNGITLPIAFPIPEADEHYAILTECDWLTVTAVQDKKKAGFTVQFATPAPASGGHLDWMLVR